MMEEPKDRVARARLAKGFKEMKEAAQAAGWPYDTYKKIEKGTRNVTTEWAAAIGRFYGVRPAWILWGEPPMSRTLDTNLTKTVASREIPVLRWSDVTTIRNVERGIDMAQVMTYAPPDLKASDLAFALKISDDSMSVPDRTAFSFNEGDEIIFDPSATVRPGDYVLAYVKELGRSVFRQFRIAAIHADGSEEIQLVPLNPNWPIITIACGKNGDIVAKMVRFARDFP